MTDDKSRRLYEEACDADRKGDHAKAMILFAALDRRLIEKVRESRDGVTDAEGR